MVSKRPFRVFAPFLSDNFVFSNDTLPRLRTICSLALYRVTLVNGDTAPSDTRWYIRSTIR